MSPHSLLRTCRPLAWLAAGLMTSVAAQAATITFQAPVTITSDAVLDAPLAYPSSTLVQAVTFGGTLQTVATSGGQSIVFALGAVNGGTDMPGTSTTTILYNVGTQSATNIFPGTTGNAAFDAVLRSNGWHNNGSDAVRPLTLRMGGLIVGQTYVVSLFSADARSTDRSQQYYDTFAAGAFSGGSSASISQNPGTMVLGTFTATNTVQDVFVMESDGIGNDDTHLAGFTLYSIPEPSSAMLIAGAGLLAGLRRRRA